MKNVLFVNHKEQACGIKQWGKRAGESLSHSNKYNFVYRESDSQDEFRSIVQEVNPTSIIYNYWIGTMGWVNPDLLDEFRERKQAVIIHEGGPQPWNEHSFDYYICINPELDVSQEWKHKVFVIGRNLLKYDGEYRTNTVPNIGSFGFGFTNKRYEDIARAVNNEFDEAEINLLIPFAKYGDEGGGLARQSVELCRREIKKPGIKLNVYHDFLPEQGVLEFLAGNDINAFLYSDMPGRGASSATDYALSVKRPIIITDTYMFKHITNHVEIPINIENSTIKQVISYGTKPLEKFYEMWSPENFTKSFERIMDEIIK